MSRDKDSPSYRPLHESAQYNAGMRLRKKILSKSNWFKKKKNVEVDQDDDRSVGGVKTVPTMGGGHEKTACGKPISTVQPNNSNGKSVAGHVGYGGKAGAGGHGKSGVKDNRQAVQKKWKNPPTISVMFVEQTPGGRLAKLLQEAEDRLSEMTGFRIRITETSGSKLCHTLPNTNPWAGTVCGRSRCFPCSQGTEKIEDCKRRNILYESSCGQCKDDHEQRYGDKPTRRGWT